MANITMTDSYYQKILLEGKAKLLKRLVDLASSERKPADARRIAGEAQKILSDLAELEDKIDAAEGPGGLDYRDEAEMNTAIIRFLTHFGRPATRADITKELIRGCFRGYKDARKMEIRVGRCIRSYLLAKASENPKLKEKNNLVGLIGWPDKMF